MSGNIVTGPGARSRSAADAAELRVQRVRWRPRADNLGLSAMGPTSGRYNRSSSTVQRHGGDHRRGVADASGAPATGVTVFPAIFIGNNSYGQVLLNPEFFYADRGGQGDPLNQTRVVSWSTTARSS